MKRILDLLRFRRSVAEEIESFLEEKTAHLMEQGVPEAEARLRARREFGNATVLAETGREILGWGWLERLAQDLRYALRTLRRSPAFTAVAVLSLALGIGANTAIFGLLDSIAWKMLPVREPEKLWAVAVARNGSKEQAGLSHSYPLYAIWRDHNRSFEGLAAGSSYAWRDKSVTSNNAWHEGQLVSGNYFDVLGVTALIGRTLTPEDDSIEGAGGPRGAVAVLSYPYWRRTYNGDPSVIGKNINVNGVWFTVVGVAPREFFGIEVGSSPDIYLPLQTQPALGPPGNLLHNTPNSETTWLTVMGRLKPGVSQAQAKAEMTALSEPYWTSRLSKDDLALYYANKKPLDRSISLEAGSRGFSFLRERYSEPLQVLLGLAGIVLLIACVNVAGLLLARANARRKEIAVRLAIGAGRLRLIRQLLTESLLLAMAGGALGVVFALWSGRLLIRMLPQRQQIPLALDVAPDYRLLGFALAVSLLTGILFGLAPALRASRLAVYDALGRGGPAAGRASRFAWNKVAIVAEMGLSVPLIVGAFLFVGTLRNLAALDTGFSQRNVMQIRFSAAMLPRNQWSTMYEQIAQRVAEVPGVVNSSLANRGLMQGGGTRSGPLQVPGYTFLPGESNQLREYHVGPGYFAAAGIPLRMGREIDQGDREKTPAVAVVNDEFVRHYLSGRNPIGARFGIGRPASFTEIVGVVGDAKYNALREDPTPMAYYPWRQQMPTRLNSVIVRTRGDSTTIAPALQRAIFAVHPDFFTDIRTLTAEIDNTLIRERLLAELSSFFGLLAMLLACLGLYGVMAYAVARRTAEIGVRMALGAVPADVIRMVLRESMLLAGAGIVIGIPLALVLTGLAKSFLYGLQPNEPWVLIAAAVSLLAVCGLAGWLPARRAARVDPMVALRWE